MPITASANQTITRALVDLRVLGVGRSVTKAHTDVAFPYLQEIVDSWQTNRWAVFRVARTRFALIAGTSEYTIGPGGTLLVKDTPTSTATEPLSFKPHWITSAKTSQPGDDFEYPVALWSRRRWLNEQQKGLDDERPRAIYMEAGIEHNTVHLWPVPESPTYDLILATPETFSAFADLATKYQLQEGYHYALRTKLRNMIGTPFGKPPSPAMIIEANDAFGMIADQNDDGPPELAPNPLNEAVSGGRQSGSYDGYSDSYY